MSPVSRFQRRRQCGPRLQSSPSLISDSLFGEIVKNPNGLSLDINIIYARLKHSNDDWCEKKVWFMQKVVITTGWSYRVLLKCILTCYWPRRPPITNKVTFAQGARPRMGFIKSRTNTRNTLLATPLTFPIPQPSITFEPLRKDVRRDGVFILRNIKNKLWPLEWLFVMDASFHGSIGRDVSTI